MFKQVWIRKYKPSLNRDRCVVPVCISHSCSPLRILWLIFLVGLFYSTARQMLCHLAPFPVIWLIFLYGHICLFSWLRTLTSHSIWLHVHSDFSGHLGHFSVLLLKITQPLCTFLCTLVYVPRWRPQGHRQGSFYTWWLCLDWPWNGLFVSYSFSSFL